MYVQYVCTVCMYVCMYDVCVYSMYVCATVQVNLHINKMFVDQYVHSICKYIRIYINVCVCMYVCMFMHIHICIYVRMFVCTYSMYVLRRYEFFTNETLYVCMYVGVPQ